MSKSKLEYMIYSLRRETIEKQQASEETKKTLLEKISKITEEIKKTFAASIQEIKSLWKKNTDEIETKIDIKIEKNARENRNLLQGINNEIEEVNTNVEIVEQSGKLIEKRLDRLEKKCKKLKVGKNKKWYKRLWPVKRAVEEGTNERN
jgi:chromosome segregation ATPase